LSGLIHVEKCQAFAQKASEGELLDQYCFFAQGMEAKALLILREELGQRGFKADALLEHRKNHGERVYFAPDGYPKLCKDCRRAATGHSTTWAKFFGLLPLFPRRVFTCDDHSVVG